MPAIQNKCLGKWRIVEMGQWDADYLDLVEPAYIRFDRGGRGEFLFGAVTGNLHCRRGDARVDFTWQGSDEMDAACGSGWVTLEDDDTLIGEIKIHLGDESGFKAKRP